MINFSSATISTTIAPEKGCFSVEISKGASRILVENACLGVRYRYRGRSYRGLYDHWNVSLEDRFESSDEQPGKLEQYSLLVDSDEHGISYQLTFAFPRNYPFLIWKLLVRNSGKQPVWIDQIDMLRVGDKAQSKMRSAAGYIQLGPVKDATDKRFYSNGWQSWSFTATYGDSDVQRLTKLGQIQSVINENYGTARPRSAGHFSGDMFGVIGDRNDGSGLLLGFLSQEQHFGSVEVWLKKQLSAALWANGDGARLDPGEVIETDWAVLQGVDLESLDSLADYLEATAKLGEVEVRPEIPTGWCSWYQYYQKVSAEDIRQNLKTLSEHKKKIPLKLVQIDDGFQSQIGDWLSFRNTFSEGLTGLSSEIRRDGFEPGLWLAPFIVHPKSKLIKEHPDYILRNQNGRPVNAGFVWNVFTRALDLTHPGALDYAWCVVEKAVKEWGYGYLKLDFLYAAALPGHHKDPTKTRAQVLRNGLKALRKAAGEETFLLGCGMPLGSGIGIFDAARIGADVSGTWYPNYMGIKPVFKKEPHIPSAKNSIQNIFTRAMLHDRWWINDPDCLLVRTDTNLTLPEIQSLATAIVLTGGSLLVSDNLSDLPEDRMRIIQQLLPLMGKRGMVIDWFDQIFPQMLRLDLTGAVGDWHLLALFNWEDKEREMLFAPGDYGIDWDECWLHSFWRNELLSCAGSVSCVIPPHGVELFAVRKKQLDEPQYLGGNLHISQGTEITSWEVGETHLTCRIELGRAFDGSVLLYLPKIPKRILFRDSPIFWKMRGENIVKIYLRSEEDGELRIEF